MTEEEVHVRKEIITKFKKHEKTKGHLEICERLFKKFDKDGNGHIDEEEIGHILIETYH